jgi:hypothetical protein
MHQLSCKPFPAELRGAECKTCTIGPASGPGPLRRQLPTLVARTSWLPGSLGYWSGSTAALVGRGSSVIFADTVQDARSPGRASHRGRAPQYAAERGSRVPAERRPPLYRARGVKRSVPVTAGFARATGQIVAPSG